MFKLQPMVAFASAVPGGSGMLLLVPPRPVPIGWQLPPS
jgi:hypothetical protein